MLRRCWGLAVLGIFLGAFAPARGQSPSTYDKDKVVALSKRIDAHLATVWKQANVTPAPKADDYVFFRRLHLDLVGRIPDLVPLTDFVDDDAADKRWTWVDRLLESREHPRHLANVWRSIIIGNQTNPQFQFLMPQFENWLRERVEKDVPLDKTVLQLLTSQGAVAGRNLGFGGNMGTANPQLFYQVNENKAESLGAATSRVFLGVKLECAQCHAHPFAKWKQDQFWEFAAFYSTPPQVVRQPNMPPMAPRPSYTPGREILIPGTEKVVKAKFLTGKEPDWNIASNSRQVLAEWVTSPDNPYFARAMADHIWSHLMGVGLLEPIMEPSDDAPITHPELLNDLAKALIDNNFDAKFLIRAIVHTDAYQRSSGGTKLAEKEDYNLFVRMPIRALTPEQIYDSVVIATVSDDKGRRALMDLPAQQQFFNRNQQQSPRAQFLVKFTNQDRRYEPQTSILQALFMMNGEFMSRQTKVENNADLQSLAQPGIFGGHEGRIVSLFRVVLSRPPRPEEIQRLLPYLERAAAADEPGQNARLGAAVSDIYWALLNTSEFLHNH